jgi:hypothetical protein
MPNLHTPERLPNESRADYRARQRASRDASRSGAECVFVGGAWRPTGAVVSLRGIGSQRKLPSQRERLRDSVRSRLHEQAVERQKAARTKMRAMSRRDRASPTIPAVLFVGP